MKLPEDPMMLYSFINMKLRDFYPSLDALCEDMNVERDEIVRTLKTVLLAGEKNSFSFFLYIYSGV